MSVLGVTAQFLVDEVEAWPRGSVIGDFRYGVALNGFGLDGSDWARSKRQDWLDRCAFAPSAYQHLAEQYRKLGYPAASDQILIAGRRRQRREHLRWWRKPWDFAYDILTGYGRKPTRLMVPLLAALAAVVLVLAQPSIQSKMVTSTSSGAVYDARGVTVVPPTSSPPANSPPVAQGHCVRGARACFNPWWFAVDTIVPIVDLGQRATWQVDTSQSRGPLLDAVLNIARLLGWFFAATLAVVLGRLTTARSGD